MDHHVANRVLLGGISAVVSSVAIGLLVRTVGGLPADVYPMRIMLPAVPLSVYGVDRLYVYLSRKRC